MSLCLSLVSLSVCLSASLSRCLSLSVSVSPSFSLSLSPYHAASDSAGHSIQHVYKRKKTRVVNIYSLLISSFLTSQRLELPWQRPFEQPVNVHSVRSWQHERRLIEALRGRERRRARTRAEEKVKEEEREEERIPSLLSSYHTERVVPKESLQQRGSLQASLQTLRRKHRVKQKALSLYSSSLCFPLC